MIIYYITAVHNSRIETETFNLGGKKRNPMKKAVGVSGRQKSTALGQLKIVGTKNKSQDLSGKPSEKKTN